MCDDLLEELHVSNTLLSPGLVASTLIEHGLTIDEQLGAPGEKKQQQNSQTKHGICKQLNRNLLLVNDILVLLHGLHLNSSQLHHGHKGRGGLLLLHNLEGDRQFDKT